MIFPIGDDQIVGGYKPWFSYGFIILNLLLFIYGISLNQNQHSEFLYQFGAIPRNVVNGYDYYTLVTNMFLHGGWMHILGNMVFLWIFADNIEATIGNIPFAILYIIGGVFASLAHIVSDPSSQVVSIGASGAIAAVLGAYLVVYPRSKVKMIFLIFLKRFQIPAYLFLGIWFVQQLFSGVGDLQNMGSQRGGVAWWAHIGGFVFGILAGLLMKILYRENISLNKQVRSQKNYI